MDYMDLLSRLGISSAHPGGFAATRKLLDKGRLEAGMRVLEVGCGTGRTACHLARQGLTVTALDRHSGMLEKARQRAEAEGADGITFVEGSILALPFPDASFDLVLAESVTIFTDVPRALREYHRVLKPQGQLLDRELALHRPMPEETDREFRSFFHMDKIYTVDEWLEAFHQAGFACTRPETDDFAAGADSAGESGMRELDVAALLDPEIAACLLRYADLMLAQKTHFIACDFVAVKVPVQMPAI